MLQWIDYHEKTVNGPITINKLAKLSEYFPELKQSVVYQGVILSKTAYTNEEVTSENIGQILGYPCYMDLEYIIAHPDEECFTMSLVAILNSGERVHIMDNRCRHMYHILEMNDMAINALAVLKNDEIFDKLIREVKVEVSKSIPVKSLINLILNDAIDEYDKLEINNYIWNLGFEILGDFNFDYSNKIHIGIVLTLLTHYDNNPLSAFYPLQKFPDYDDRVNELTLKWEQELLKILKYI